MGYECDTRSESRPDTVRLERVKNYLLENHPADSRVQLIEDGVCQTLSSRMGTGGGNVPLVLEVIDGEENICGEEVFQVGRRR